MYCFSDKLHKFVCEILKSRNMKSKFIYVSFCFLLVSSISFSQKKHTPKSIISENSSIKKYHTKSELESKSKGALLELYIERVESLSKTLPYIAFSTKPGITLSSFGIPNSKANRKDLDRQFETTNNYLENTTKFHNKYLPYSDTSNMVDAILFYEEIMKLLHEYNEFR